MKKMAAAVICVFIFSLQSYVSAEQKIENDYFTIVAGDKGITSLKRTKDIYDTDYILSRNSIGDILVSYRLTGEEEYREVKAAGLKTADKDSALYQISVEQQSFLSSVRPSASRNRRAAFALNDGAHIENSSNRQNGFFNWSPGRGTKEWVQYDFPKEVTVSAVEVYWFDDYSIGGPYRVPQSWKLLYRSDDGFKEVSNPSGYGVDLDKFVKVTFEPVKTSALRIEAQLYEEHSGGILEWRFENDQDAGISAEASKSAEELSKQISITSGFELDGPALLWNINIRNLSDKPMELGDVGLPLRFNTQYVWEKMVTYTQRLIRHFLIAGNGSFIFFTRTNAEPPFLLMIPAGDTALEYFDSDAQRGRSFCVFVHSKAKAAARIRTGGNWRQENTSVTLAPKGKKGDSVGYTFKFRWADGYDGVRDLLYQESKFDIQVVPGMAVPTDLYALLAVRTKNRIDSLKAEYPNQTTIKYLGEKQKDTHIYKVTFSKLGENMLTINYDKKKMVLEFFVTEPLETLIKKRAAFLVNSQQVRDPEKWYNCVYGDWDMKNHILRNADDRDGLSTWLTDSCDDAGNARPAYVASKNVFFPDRSEIESVDCYIKNYLWGGMQQTEDEPYPYGIYGIPNWKVNRDSNDEGRNGKKHLWRIYDYPHIVLLYYRMYQIAEFYPEIKTELTKDQYLQRAFKTAVAFFTVPMEIEKWSAYETPTMNEIVMNDLLSALDAEGKTKEAGELRKHWEKKVAHYVNDDPYLFGSEFPFDSTGFETTGAMAKYAMENVNKADSTLDVNSPDVLEFLEKQLRLNIACRGWLETAYYYLGSDYRSGSGMAYTLSYMSQMGGWSVLDYALYYAKDPFKYLRLGYASYLSSWALMNTGTPQSNYGFWYPGKENDGAAGGGFEPMAYATSWLGKSHARGCWYYSAEEDVGYNGAIRTSATIIADDPLFGLFAYGGILTGKKDGIEVIPKDGLRNNLHIIKENKRFSLLLERDGFAEDQSIAVKNSLEEIAFVLENRAGSEHKTKLTVSGLPAGSFAVKINGRQAARQKVDSSGQIVFNIPVSKAVKTCKVTIVKLRDNK